MYGRPEKSALRIGAAPLDRDQDGSSLKGMFFMDSKHGEKIFGRGIRSVYKELHADHETGAADNK